MESLSDIYEDELYKRAEGVVATRFRPAVFTCAPSHLPWDSPKIEPAPPWLCEQSTMVPIIRCSFAFFSLRCIINTHHTDKACSDFPVRMRLTPKPRTLTEPYLLSNCQIVTLSESPEDFLLAPKLGTALAHLSQCAVSVNPHTRIQRYE